MVLLISSLLCLIVRRLDVLGQREAVLSAFTGEVRGFCGEVRTSCKILWRSRPIEAEGISNAAGRISNGAASTPFSS